MPSTPGQRTYCYSCSFLARLTILPRGNCKTYSISYSWWILWVSKVRPLLEDLVNAISKHVTGTLILNKNIWSTMLNFLYQLSKHRCMGNIMKSLPLTLMVFYFLSCHGYHAPLVLRKDIPLKYVCIHIFLPIVLIKPGNHLSSPLVCLTLLVIYII